MKHWERVRKQNELSRVGRKGIATTVVQNIENFRLAEKEAKTFPKREGSPLDHPPRVVGRRETREGREREGKGRRWVDGGGGSIKIGGKNKIKNEK